MDRNCSLEQHLKEKYILPDDQIRKIVEEISKRFLPHFNQKFKSAYQSKAKFLEKYNHWLKGEFIVNLESSEKSSNSSLNTSRGRPEKPFEECSERAKRYKIQVLRDMNSQKLIDASASPVSKLTDTGFDVDATLAIITQAKLSKYQYEIIRKATKDIGHNIFPSYEKLIEAKKKCYPKNINVTETAAKVSLQDLLDHTSTRLLETKTEDDIKELEEEDLILHTKWGCDGASGQSEYMQTFSQSAMDISDSNLFMTSIVPLNMTLADNKLKSIWKNSRPSSTRYCRALKFEFRKETHDLIREEKIRVENEIKHLCETEINMHGRSFKVRHILYFTMIDGKVAQAVTNTTSASNCVVCGAKPSEMNIITKLQNRPLNEEAIKMGMSVLHARIRFMEYILHLSYKLGFKLWRTSKENRPIKEETKKRIQNQFREKLGIQVDIVKQGMGTTNNGNTSRRFFGNPTVTAEITQIDETFIKRLAVILEIISCNFDVDAKKFGMYAHETAQLAVSLYPWYHMPSTVHKILIHGREIIESAALPIGSLSEEAQESRNKDYKYYRLHNTRKFSRLVTNEDVFHNILISSDPYISHRRPEPKTKSLPLSEEAKTLLKER